MQGLEKRRQESEHRMAEMQRHSDEFSQMNIESMKKAQAQTEAWRQQSEQSRASVAQATQSPTLPSNLSQPQSLEYYWYCTSCKKEISGLNDICSCVWRRLFKIVGGLIMVVGSVIGFCFKAKRS